MFFQALFQPIAYCWIRTHTEHSFLGERLKTTHSQLFSYLRSTSTYFLPRWIKALWMEQELNWKQNTLSLIGNLRLLDIKMKISEYLVQNSYFLSLLKFFKWGMYQHLAGFLGSSNSYTIFAVKFKLEKLFFEVHFCWLMQLTYCIQTKQHLVLLVFECRYKTLSYF